MNQITKFLSTLGPGILMAGAAIGVSHLVQSTRAGAEFGYTLIPLVILVNILKYPFFEYGHRYTVATGKNLLEGYKELGTHYLWAFLIVNFITAMGSITALFFVTSSILVNLLNDFIPNLGEFALLHATVSIILLCILIYNLGHYRVLDRIIKTLMFVLFFATVGAFLIAIYNANEISLLNLNESPFQMKYLPFLLALMGWMPGPIEMSVWQSLWMQAKERDTSKKISRKEANIDFNIGYILCLILSVVFIALGAIVMHGSSTTFSNSGVKFAGQLVDLYARNIGSWSTPIITFCALITIFSTSLTLYDAYPRSLAEGVSLVSNRFKSKYLFLKVFFSLIAGLFATLVIYYFIQTKKGMTLLVDVVTIMAFITAPFFAFLNTKLVFTSKTMPESMMPNFLMKVISVVGIIFLSGFVVVFLISKTGIVKLI